MCRSHSTRHLLHAMLAAWLCFTTHANAEVASHLSSRFLARGEQALLEVVVAGAPPSAAPAFPVVDGVEIRPLGEGAQIRQFSGRAMEYTFSYLVSSYATGKHVLPAFEVLSGGVKARSEPIEIRVFNPDELQWSEVVTGEGKMRYASTFQLMNPQPYEGESTPVEIKLYVPRELLVEDWGVPEFQRDGVTSWRFQPSAARGQVNLLGRPYAAVAYPSVLAPMRSGKLGIGPASMRLMTVETVMDGVLRRISRELNMTVPKLEFEAMPLPGNAPAGFENAVGNFTMEISSSQVDAQEGDPIPVDIVVRGSGNLDTLRPPRPVETQGWKVYEATPEQRGDERRELSGRTVFHQFIRALEIKPALPSFRLVYFDPKDASYKSLTSDPIPLRMTPAPLPKSAAPQPPDPMAVPVERMTDILGLLRTAPLTRPTGSRFPAWFGHALGALLALGLIVKALAMRYAGRLRKDPIRVQRRSELRELERLTPGDASGFLMAAGRFVERWFGSNPHADLQAVLAERDSLCFQPEKPAAARLDSRRREAILRLLRKAALVAAAMILLGGGAGQARAQHPPAHPHAAAGAADLSSRALEAYDSARYDEAIRLWLQAGRYDELTSATLYNIGNACYRAGSPGYAALYYRRALVRDPGQQESRQNLGFIERKHGSITVHRPEYQYALARLPLAAWQGMVWTAGWLALLAVLVFPATRPGARLRMAAISTLMISTLVATAGVLGWHYFPNDAEFAPLARQAVIIGENVTLHADAARTSPEVIDAPPGSLCEVLQQSGHWAYVAFASKTRGWIPREAIEMVLPPSPPAVPVIRKPKADSKSA